MNKELKDMDMKDFLSLPYAQWDEGIGPVRSLVVIPEKTEHDSGYRNMSFVAECVDGTMWRLGGGTDDVNFTWEEGIRPNLEFDCLPITGLVRFWLRSGTFSVGPALSSVYITVNGDV